MVKTGILELTFFQGTIYAQLSDSDTNKQLLLMSDHSSE
jgi:hypothetical protein